MGMSPTPAMPLTPGMRASLPGLPKSTDLPFWYPLNPPALTALQANVPASVVVNNDADFEWRWIIGNSTGLYSVQLVDNYTTRPLMQAYINAENMVGTAQLPFILPKPWVLRRTSSISALFTDRSGAGNTIQLCLVGYKLGLLSPYSPQS
jgi:hypothetical protein